MPCYDYRCEPCQKTFEVTQSMCNVAATADCPRCQQPAARWFGSTSFGIGLCNTNWIAGNWHNRDFEQQPNLGERPRAAALKAGVSITGKRFNHALADYPTDPEAWVGSLDEARETARRKGLTVKVEDGDLKVTGESHFARKRRLALEAQGRERKARLEQKSP